MMPEGQDGSVAMEIILVSLFPTYVTIPIWYTGIFRPLTVGDGAVEGLFIVTLAVEGVGDAGQVWLEESVIDGIVEVLTRQ